MAKGRSASLKESLCTAGKTWRHRRAGGLGGVQEGEDVAEGGFAKPAQPVAGGVLAGVHGWRKP